MRYALDLPFRDGKKICADITNTDNKYYCQKCLQEVKPKAKDSKHYRPYFTHQRGSDCVYDHDNESPWHIRMKSYFSQGLEEQPFPDEKNNDTHIADIYLPKSDTVQVDTVIEFQRSHIKDEEFWARTLFHYREGRRVLWIFDEEVEDKDSTYERFKRAEYSSVIPIYEDRTYDWKRSRRSFLSCVPEEGTPLNPQLPTLSICIFTGKEGRDVVHRIVYQEGGYKTITFSLHDIEMKENMDVEEFFYLEDHWQEMEPWKSAVLDYKRRQMSYAQPRVYNSYNERVVRNALNKMARMNRGRNRRF